jgi:hypothetical protein
VTPRKSLKTARNRKAKGEEEDEVEAVKQRSKRIPMPINQTHPQREPERAKERAKKAMRMRRSQARRKEKGNWTNPKILSMRRLRLGKGGRQRMTRRITWRQL